MSLRENREGVLPPLEARLPGDAVARLPLDEREAAAERSQRDLICLLALPSLWVGRDGATILRLMVEAVERAVPVDFCYMNVDVDVAASPVATLRVEGRTLVEHSSAWQGVVARCLAMPHVRSKPTQLATPLGELNTIRLDIGYGGAGGSIWYGSALAGFPSVVQLSFLRAAASLAATGLQGARISRDREEASRAKDEFLAMLGHELRNPLAPIVTALKIIELKSRQPLDREHAIIERQVAHLARLVDDLLDVARIARGRVELKKEIVDIRTILTRALASVSPLLEQRRHLLSVDLPQEGAFVFGDATRLCQVFSNLLINAAKFTEPGGAISLTVRVTQRNLSVAVRDNGLGIGQALLPRVFSIFEQGKSTIDRSSGGLGIGLALVKSFVELHAGTVVAASQGPGHGCEFTVTLPLCEALAAEAPPTEPAQEPPRQNAARVLIVDDNADADALEMMKYLLQLAGYVVATACDSAEAAAGGRPLPVHGGDSGHRAAGDEWLRTGRRAARPDGRRAAANDRVDRLRTRRRQGPFVGCRISRPLGEAGGTGRFARRPRDLREESRGAAPGSMIRNRASQPDAGGHCAVRTARRPCRCRRGRSSRPTAPWAVPASSSRRRRP